MQCSVDSESTQHEIKSWLPGSIPWPVVVFGESIKHIGGECSIAAAAELENDYCAKNPEHDDFNGYCKPLLHVESLMSIGLN